MKEVGEVGNQANERVGEEEVQVLDEEGIPVKTGGQESDSGLYTYRLWFTLPTVRT
jgi:hypothetical protein